MPPPPLLLPNPAGYQYPSEGLSDAWKPSESPTRVKARLDGLEVIETVIGMMPESPTRIKARLDGLDQLPNKQFVLPVSISASRFLFLLCWRKKQWQPEIENSIDIWIPRHHFWGQFFLLLCCYADRWHAPVPHQLPRLPCCCCAALESQNSEQLSIKWLLVPPTKVRGPSTCSVSSQLLFSPFLSSGRLSLKLPERYCTL